MMTGRKPIVCRLKNNHFHEHADVASAQQEAERLARSGLGGEFVVYVPVVSVRRPPDVLVTPIPVPVSQQETDDLPW
jgi:hypothetical protein